MASEIEKHPADDGPETFYQRFSRIVDESGLSDTDIGSIMGLSAANVGRVKSGQRKSIRLDAGLRLCAKLDLDPWDLAFGRPRLAVGAQPAAGTAAQYTPLADFQALQADFQRLREGLGGAAAIAGESHQAVPAPEATRKKPGTRARRDRKGQKKAQ